MPCGWYVGKKATDRKATGSLYIGCFFVGTKVAFLSAQKGTIKMYLRGTHFGHNTLDA